MGVPIYENDSEFWDSTVGVGSNLFEHITGGNDRAMIVLIYELLDIDVVTSIKYNGTDLTEEIRKTGTGRQIYIWTLKNPDAGTYDLDIVVTQSTDMHVHIITLENVDQSGDPFGTAAGNNGADAAPTVDVASSISDLVIDIIGYSDYDVVPTEQGSQVGFADTNSGSGIDTRAASSYVAGSATTTTMDWSLTETETWLAAGIAVAGKPTIKNRHALL